jgi:hypothetical protein
VGISTGRITPILAGGGGYGENFGEPFLFFPVPFSLADRGAVIFLFSA